ncbi:MAG: thermonuclease family protein [Treponema sp.]|jgi:micrococcal nuclease|nr:thermonuclease family protein [Treponema sp.]
MKKLLLVTVIFGIACGCLRTEAQTISTQDNARFAEADLVVYVTNSGARYHVDGCSSLRSSRIPVTLADAVVSGYEACSICKPPRLRTPPPDTGRAALYRVNVEEPANSAAVELARLLRAEVIGHVDGDTVRVRIADPSDLVGVVETIRLIGVDTPETVHPRREVEAFGKEAGEFTKNRLLGKIVYLAFDWDLRDKYNRLLAYIYTGDGRCHNAEIIRAGYGHAYTNYSFHFIEEFRAIEREAREARRGLWQ